MTSAKDATGIAKILEILEKTRKNLETSKFLPKVYVVGATNSGKSSLLNAMLYKALNARKDSKEKSKRLTYRSKFDLLTVS